MKCDSCGYDMTNEDGGSLICVSVQVGEKCPERPRIKRVFGKSDFNICYFCYIKSLGVKRIKK